MADDDRAADWLAAGAALLLGYWAVKAATERRCGYCSRTTPRNAPYCRHCGSYLG